jgi:hypothetical protein
MSNYEDASRCPKCRTPGKLVNKRSVPSAGLPPGTQVHVFLCPNERCRWFDTKWLVQVDRDGTVPPEQNHTRTDPVYTHNATAERDARDIANVRRMLEQERDRQRDGGS